MLVRGKSCAGARLACIINPTSLPRLSIVSCWTSWPLDGRHVQKKLQLRCFAQEPSRQPATQNVQQQRAKAASDNFTKHASVGVKIPERLIIYHAGPGRVAFLAMLKLTSLLVGAVFILLVVPSYVTAEKPIAQTAAMAMAGIAPILFVSYSTSPFVTHIHIHIPSVARTSRAVLERFVDAMPASSRLTFTTMSLVAKPRYSSLTVADLQPARGKRFGLVNFMRDTSAENLTRKWYMYRAVGGFYVQPRSGKGKRYEKKGKVDGWIWDAVRRKVEGTRA